MDVEKKKIRRKKLKSESLSIETYEEMAERFKAADCKSVG